jgi:uncharacterized protein (TIGR03437 family)
MIDVAEDHMDATQLSSRKLAIFLTSALLLAAAPWAQAQSLVTTASISVSSLVGQGTQLSVTSSDGSVITFSAVVSYPSGGPSWLSIDNSCGTVTGLTTPASLTLAHGCGGSNAGIQPATITLTPTSPAGATGATVTATLGSALGTIVATGIPGGNGALNLNAVPGGSATGAVTLSTSSSSAIGFTITPPAGVTWLSVSQTGGTAGQVFAGNSATLTVFANAAGLSVSPAPATININYNNVSTPILVTFTVGGTGTGSLQLSQTSVPWSYTTNGTLPGTNAISVTSPNGAAFYTASVTNITGGVSWLSVTVNGVTSTYSPGSQPIGSILYLAGNSSMASLPTGNYSATVQVTDSNSNTNYVYVNLSVNGANTALTLSPNPVNLSAAYGSTTLVQTTATLTSTVGGAVTATTSGTGLQYGASLSSSSVGAGGSVQITIYATASGIAPGTYNGYLNVTVGGTTQQFPIVFQVGSGTGFTGNSIGPGSFQFNFQTDGTQGNPPTQYLMIGGSQTFTATASQNTTSNSVQWLSVTPGSGVAPAQIFVSVSPVGMAAGSYSGTVTVRFNDGTSQSATVNLTVTSGTPQVYAQPGTWVVNQPAPGTASTSIYLYSTNGTQVPVTISTTTSWLSFISTLPTTTQSSFAVQANTAALANGINQGSITVTSGATSLSIPVIVYMTNGTGTGTGVLTNTPSSISLNSQVGTSTAATTTLYVTTSGTTTYFTAAPSETTCTQTTWLSINVTQAYVYNGFSQPITVSATPVGLTQGTCTGTIQLSANGLTQSVPVTFTIGGGITLSASSLSFQFASGGSTPAAQTINVTNPSGAAVHYSATVATTSGGNWLSISPASGTTPGQISVSVNPSGMAAGSYTGTVSVTPDGGAPTNLTVSFTITTPSITVSATSLSFSYQAGGTPPAAQSVAVTGGGFTASASSTGNWLSVSPTSSATGTNIAVSVSPSSLSAGTYNGTVTVTGAGGATGSATINVTLTVTAPLPSITAVVNAASFASGALSPGEVISIGGTGLGPASPAFLTLDSSGNVATTIGGVTVTIGGYPAPLIYVSSTQINAVVPYEVAGQISFGLVVKYLGQASNGFNVSGTVAMPGIFTQSASGSGPGAILNQDYSVNGPSRPAAKGSVIQVFMTGEGKTTPVAVTGKVNNVTDASQLPVPLLSVSASVGGQPAQVVFAAEAPGLVSGVMQVNIIVPNTVASGAQAIVINVGTTSSQTGVTVNVQ